MTQPAAATTCTAAVGAAVAAVLVVSLLEPEVPGRPAAAGDKHLEGDTGFLEQRPFRVVADDLVLMTASGLDQFIEMGITTPLIFAE